MDRRCLDLLPHILLLLLLFHLVLPSSSSADGKRRALRRSTGEGLTVSRRFGHWGDLLEEDRLRVESINQRLLPNSTSLQSTPVEMSGSQLSVPARRRLFLGNANYVVTVGLGSPVRSQTVLFDTGSSLSWVQCRPCRSCYPQKEPVFDPATSSTYRNLSCSSDPCVLLQQGGCLNERCSYIVVYGDGSLSSGYLGEDTLALASSHVLPRFVFGCGESTTGLFGSEAGLFGLGREPFSLASQASAKYGEVFSYCLPSATNATGDLTFGPANATGAVAYTPMLNDSRDPSLYFLNLTGISVDGRPIPVSPEVFSAAGTLIDSGTVFTRIPTRAYEELRKAFRSGMARYKLVKAESFLDTCYDLRGLRNVVVPAVALHFAGRVTVKLPYRGIIFAANASQACLAFAPTLGVGIIGNTQQASRRVVYDLKALRIGFGPAASCG